MNKTFFLFFLLAFTSVLGKDVIVITDCYHPYQDPGDNLDLLHSYGLKDISAKGIILDITDAFRKDTADHPTLWKDPRGPREAGIIPLLPLEYIFGKKIPYAIGPVSMMQHERDEMRGLRAFEEEGILLFLQLLRDAQEPIEVLSFGSARVLAVAFNREPELLKAKIKMIHLSAGTASQNHELGKDVGANMIPGGEWNVALDVHAFNRILKSDLPLILYPCAGKDGGFVKDVHNTYFTLRSLDFLKELRAPIQNFIHYAFTTSTRKDFLRAMDEEGAYSRGEETPFKSFHFWETPIWIMVRELVIVADGNHSYSLKKSASKGERVVSNQILPIRFTEIRDDGRFQFEKVKTSRQFIFYREDLEDSERALNAIVPQVLKEI